MVEGVLKSEISVSERQEKVWFGLIILYLIIDLGRPQDIINIGFIRPGLICTIGLLGFVIAKGKFYFSIKEIKIVWLFLILLAVHVPFASNNYYAYKTAEGFLSRIPFILSLVFCVTNIRRVKMVINAQVLIMIYIAVFSIGNLGKGSGGWFRDENDMSLYMNVMIPFCYFLFSSEDKILSKVIYGAGLFLGIFAIIKSFSRGGFIGLIAVGITIWIGSRRKAMTAFVVCILSVFVYFAGDKEFWTEMSTVTRVEEGTAEWRVMAWGSAWRMFIDNPLGVGGNNFQIRFPEYQPKGEPREYWGRVAHSIWFTLIPELGVPGIVLYFLLIFYTYRNLWNLIKREKDQDNRTSRYLRSISLATIAGLSGYFASGTFLSVFYYPYFWYFAALSVVCVNVSEKSKMDAA